LVRTDLKVLPPHEMKRVKHYVVILTIFLIAYLKWNVFFILETVLRKLSRLEQLWMILLLVWSIVIGIG
jgi:hypothetical protein